MDASINQIHETVIYRDGDKMFILKAKTKPIHVLYSPTTLRGLSQDSKRNILNIITMIIVTKNKGIYEGNMMPFFS